MYSFHELKLKYKRFTYKKVICYVRIFPATLFPTYQLIQGQMTSAGNVYFLWTSIMCCWLQAASIYIAHQTGSSSLQRVLSKTNYTHTLSYYSTEFIQMDLRFFILSIPISLYQIAQDRNLIWNDTRDLGMSFAQ